MLSLWREQYSLIGYLEKSQVSEFEGQLQGFFKIKFLLSNIIFLKKNCNF